MEKREKEGKKGNRVIRKKIQKGGRGKTLVKRGKWGEKKIRKRIWKRPHITGPHLFFYEKKLTRIWGWPNKTCTYSKKSEKSL